MSDGDVVVDIGEVPVSEPYDPNKVRVTITSMVLDNGTPKVDWSYAHNGAPKHPKGSNPFPRNDIMRMLSSKTNLIVAEAHVGKSLVMKRWRPRARGRVGRILKPFSRLTIVVREVEEAS